MAFCAESRPGSARDDGCLAFPSAHGGLLLLDLALTAVDEEFTAGDVTAFVGGEERDRFGDLIRGSRSAQRNGRNDGLDVVVLLLLRHSETGVIARRRNDARTDRVDADALALQVHSPIAGKRAERRFGGTVDAEGRVSLNGNQRGVQDNRAARGHERQCALNREERALDVDIELLVEMFLLNLSQRSELTDAGIGEEDVEFALLLADGLINLVDIPQARDISLDTGCRLADLANRLVEFFLAASRDIYRGAALCEEFGCRQSDSAAPSCHQGDFSVKLRVHIAAFLLRSITGSSLCIAYYVPIGTDVN